MRLPVYQVVKVVDDGNGGLIGITDPVETLGTYNAERSRGIVHTPEWQIAMARLQREFDARQREDR